jgi:hypothetical protein
VAQILPAGRLTSGVHLWLLLYFIDFILLCFFPLTDPGVHFDLVFGVDLGELFSRPKKMQLNLAYQRPESSRTATLLTKLITASDLIIFVHWCLRGNQELSGDTLFEHVKYTPFDFLLFQLLARQDRRFCFFGKQAIS